MRKIVIFISIFILFNFICTSCNTAGNLPEGMKEISEESIIENTKHYEGMRIQVLPEELYATSKLLAKFKIIDTEYIEFMDSCELRGKTYEYVKIGTFYTVKFSEIYFGEGIELNKKYVIYIPRASEHIERIAYPQKGNEYIAFLDSFDNYLWFGAKAYADYHFIDLETGIILCKDDNSYIINDILAEYFNITGEKYIAPFKGDDFQNYFYDEIMPEKLEGSTWTFFKTEDIGDILMVEETR